MLFYRTSTRYSSPPALKSLNSDNSFSDNSEELYPDRGHLCCKRFIHAQSAGN